MIQLIYSLTLFLTGIIAGVVGSFTGLGGATVITPALTLIFGIPLEFAAGASLVATIATSCSATQAYIKDRITNLKIGLSLEIATTVGAIVGAVSAAMFYSHNLAYLLFIVFGIVVLLSVYPTLHKRKSLQKVKPDWSTRFFQLKGKYYDESSRRTTAYSGVRWWLGESIMLVAGIISGLLGVGSGVLKVLAMDSGMRLPIKVSTATSDFMIGVTAVTGSAIYWGLGYIKPLLVAPIILGVFLGAYLGSRLMVRESMGIVRKIFVVILLAVAVEMILRGLGIA